MWIEDFRTKYGLERDEFARRVRVLGARKRPERPIGCTEALVYMLERSSRPITHPNIADLLAEACGATAEQRDSIVAKKWRGEWKGDGIPRCLKGCEWTMGKAKEAAPGPRDQPYWRRGVAGRRSIVKIDANGNVLERYVSLTQATALCGQSMNSIGERARKCVRNEFIPGGHSFRFAEEWDKMTPEERRKDLEWVAKFAERKRDRSEK